MFRQLGALSNRWRHAWKLCEHALGRDQDWLKEKVPEYETAHQPAGRSSPIRLRKYVEMKGIEPTTSSLRTKRSAN